MTELAPTYTRAIDSIRREHMAHELDGATRAINQLRERVGEITLASLHWRDMPEDQQNAMYADLRDLRLRIEALVMGAEA